MDSIIDNIAVGHVNTYIQQQQQTQSTDTANDNIELNTDYQPLIDIDAKNAELQKQQQYTQQHAYDLQLLDSSTYDIIDKPHSVHKHSTFNILRYISPSALKRFAVECFLPTGYPHTVTGDYTAFQIYDTLQEFANNLRGILCTQAILTGLGVGNDTRAVSVAVIFYIIRDACGMLGSLIFGYMNSATFEVNVKQYRIIADLTNNMAATFDLASAMVPEQFFIFVICSATVFRAICGICAAATRGALFQHFAKCGNFAEINTKESMQGTGLALVSMLLGIILAYVVDGDMKISWTLFIIFTVLHIFLNVMTMRVVVFDTLNKQRTLILLRYYVKTGIVLTPTQVADRESVFALYTDQYRLGSAIKRKLLDKIQYNELLQSNKYYCHQTSHNCIDIYLIYNSTSIDQLHAIYDAIHMYTKTPFSSKHTFDRFMKLARKSGWKLDEHLIRLEARNYRYCTSRLAQVSPDMLESV